MFNVSMELEENLDPVPRERLPPPIIVPSIVWRKAAAKLVTLALVDSIHAKAFRDDHVKVQCVDGEMFQIVQRYLKTNNAEFYTFPKPEERSIKIITRGLTTDISDEELKSQGYEVTHIRRFIKEGRKLKMHMATLLSSPANKAIFNLTSLLFMAIKVEPYRSINHAQCYNCQHFGHSSRHYGYPHRCLKCAGEHSTQVCQKTKEELPKCTNCLGTHTANYKQCPVFLKTKLDKQPLCKKNLLTQQPQKIISLLTLRHLSPHLKSPTQTSLQ